MPHEEAFAVIKATVHNLDEEIVAESLGHKRQGGLTLKQKLMAKVSETISKLSNDQLQRIIARRFVHLHGYLH